MALPDIDVSEYKLEGQVWGVLVASPCMEIVDA